MNKGAKVSNEVAIKEVTDFLKKHKAKDFRRGKMNQALINEDYIDAIEAVEDGLLTFDEKMKPTYELRNPLYTDKADAALHIKKVGFRSRIKEADKNLLMDGLDMKKQMGTYTLKYIAYICQLHVADVKNLEKDDFETLNQICSVF
jgi:hypothetical protein